MLKLTDLQGKLCLVDPTTIKAVTKKWVGCTRIGYEVGKGEHCMGYTMYVKESVEQIMKFLPCKLKPIS